MRIIWVVLILRGQNNQSQEWETHSHHLLGSHSSTMLISAPNELGSFIAACMVLGLLSFIIHMGFLMSYRLSWFCWILGTGDFVSDWLVKKFET